jgi:peptidylprolyl isomerase
MNLTSPLSVPLIAIAASAFAVSTAAQTAHTTHPVHHTATHTSTHEAEHRGGCVTVPPVSTSIPALPADAPCPKALYTLTRKPDVVLEYASPLVSAATREELSPKPITVSLLYVDTKIGTGALAQPHKWYTVNYTGYLPDGKKFDSSYDRKQPISFPYGERHVIAGWDTGFEGMHVGGKRRLYVPYELAYGEQGRPPAIPPESELIFDVELVAQSDTPPPPPAPPAKPEPPAAHGAPAGAGPAHTAEPGRRAEPANIPAKPKPENEPAKPAATK